VPRLCEFYPDICLITEEKAQKNLSQGKKTFQSTVYKLPKHPHITKPTHTHTHTHTHQTHAHILHTCPRGSFRLAVSIQDHFKNTVCRRIKIIFRKNNYRNLGANNRHVHVRLEPNIMTTDLIFSIRFDCDDFFHLLTHDSFKALM